MARLFENMLNFTRRENLAGIKKGFLKQKSMKKQEDPLQENTVTDPGIINSLSDLSVDSSGLR